MQHLAGCIQHAARFVLCKASTHTYFCSRAGVWPAVCLPALVEVASLFFCSADWVAGTERFLRVSSASLYWRGKLNMLGAAVAV